MAVLQMASGQAAIFYFSGEIFELVCPDSEYECILGLGVIKLIAAFSMTFIGECWGRRTFLLLGTSVLFTGLFVFTICLASLDFTGALIGLFV